MEVVGGIDGGQSSTRAAVGDLQGRVLGRGTGPPADLVGEPPGSPRQRFALESALASALRDAGLAATTRLAALVIGLTGHDDGLPAPFAMAHARTSFVHDTAIAHAGAFGGGPGVVVLAGTGSVALGNAAGSEFVRAGGWGYYFGDEGGALWIARRAIAAAMASSDRGESTPLGRAALAFFGLPELRAIQHGFASGALTRAALATFAGPALALDSRDARRLRAETAAALAELAVTVGELLPSPEALRVSYAGGVFGNDDVCASFSRFVRRRLPNAVTSTPLAEPLAGALLLARDAARGPAAAGRADD